MMGFRDVGLVYDRRGWTWFGGEDLLKLWWGERWIEVGGT